MKVLYRYEFYSEDKPCGGLLELEFTDLTEEAEKASAFNGI